MISGCILVKIAGFIQIMLHVIYLCNFSNGLAIIDGSVICRFLISGQLYSEAWQTLTPFG
jgi:hypothetical protein